MQVHISSVCVAGRPVVSDRRKGSFGKQSFPVNHPAFISLFSLTIQVNRFNRDKVEGQSTQISALPELTKDLALREKGNCIGQTFKLELKGCPAFCQS